MSTSFVTNRNRQSILRGSLVSKFLDNNSTAAVILNVERGIGLFKFGFMIIIIAIASCFQTFANPSSTHTKNRRKKKK